MIKQGSKVKVHYTGKYTNDSIFDTSYRDDRTALEFVVGEGQLREHYGAKPMNIKWELNEPLPHYLWKDAAKLRVG